MNCIFELCGLAFVLVNVVNGMPLYQTQTFYTSDFFFVKCISNHRFEVSCTDAHGEHDQYLDTVASFKEAAQVILTQIDAPW